MFFSYESHIPLEDKDGLRSSNDLSLGSTEKTKLAGIPRAIGSTKGTSIL